MARGVNKVILIGNLGQDPVYRVEKFGGIVTASLATTDRVKDNDDQWTDQTQWHNLVFKRQAADYVRDYAKKGMTLYVEGQNRTRKWKDKNFSSNNITHYRTEILVKEVQIVGGRSPNYPPGGDQQTTSPATRPGQSPKAGGDTPTNDFDDDIPF